MRNINIKNFQKNPMTLPINQGEPRTLPEK